MSNRPADRRATDSPALSIGVVVPTHRGGRELARCLAALAHATPPADEVVVVLDGPATGAREVAESYSATVVEAPAHAGPAGARNLGAEATTADVILFIDSDVVIPTGAVGRVARYLAGRPEVAAVFGSYDDAPPAPGLVSQYKNLFHHFTHQHGSVEASTFWTGCGAVRRAVLASVGGFDPDQRWLEDVDLGYRLRLAGHRIHLDRELQVTHLKSWSFGALLTSDLLHRAFPWTELIHRYRLLPNDLNLGTGARVSAALALLLAGSLAMLPWWGWAWLATCLAALLLLAANQALYRFLLRRRGLQFATGAIALHWLYLVYSAGAFVTGSIWWTVRRRVRGRGVTGQPESDSDRSRAA